MLVKYKKDYQKIIMGFLSYLPEFSNLTNLQEEMALYDEDGEYQIYLYRKEANADFSAIVGFQKIPHFVIVRYISCAISARNTKTCNQILTELHNLYPTAKVMPTLENSELFAAFERTQEDD